MHARLPRNRKWLRHGFLLTFLPAYLVLATVGSGCEFASFCFDDDLVETDPDAFTVKSGRNQLTHQAADIPGTLLEKNKETTIFSMSMGMPMFMPAGHLFFNGFVSDLDNPDSTSRLPKKIDCGIRYRRDGAILDDYMAELSQKNGNITQPDEMLLPMMRTEPGDEVDVYVKSRGKDWQNQFLTNLNMTFHPSTTGLFSAAWRMGPASAWRTFRTLRQMRAEGKQGVPIPLGATISAGAKQDMLTITFGLPIEVGDGRLVVTGGFAGASARRRAALPKKMLMFVTLKDEQGQTIDRFKLVVRVRDGEFRQKEFAIGPWSIEAGYTLRAQIKTKGGSIEPSDGPVGSIQFVID